MFEVVLDRDYYSKSAEIFQHLREMFDMPKNSYIPWRGMIQDVGDQFCVNQVFGYTTIEFKKEDDANRFREWAEQQ